MLVATFSMGNRKIRCFRLADITYLYKAHKSMIDRKGPIYNYNIPTPSCDLKSIVFSNS